MKIAIVSTLLLTLLISCTDSITNPIQNEHNKDNTLLDYFPLNEGNQWTYSYQYSNNCWKTRYEAIATLEVIEKKDTLAIIREIKDYEYATDWEGNEFDKETDTTFISLKLTEESLTLYDDLPTSSIKIPIATETNKDSVHVIDQYSVQYYEDNEYDLVGEVENTALAYSIIFAKDIGPVKLYSRWFTNCQYPELYELVDYHLSE